MNQIQHPDGSLEFVESTATEVTPPVSAPADQREAAYRAEADQYLAAYTGYLLEGRTAEAEEQKALYLARKAEIRGRFPDVEPENERR